MQNTLSTNIVKFGVSESFLALIQGIRDTYGISGPKYRRESVDKVNQYLICRNYGKACLELSYLCWAIIHRNEHKKSGYQLLEFFYVDENITPSKVREAFECITDNNPISLSEQGIEITSSTSSFVISPARVSVLAVLLEVIVSIDANQLTLLEQTLSKPFSSQIIKACSSDLQKIVYQFLAKHLVQAQQQKRFRYISQWLAANATQNTTIDISDELILRFWQSASLDKLSPGYVLFTSAVTDFIDADIAYRQVLMKDTISMSSGEGDHYGHGSHDQSSALVAESNQSFEWLTGSPKFITKAQWQFVRFWSTKPFYLKKLATSFTRQYVFGHWQSNIIQAQRKSKAASVEKLSQGPDLSYLEYQQNIDSLLLELNQLKLAICYIFYQLNDSRYLGLLLNLSPKEVQIEVNQRVDALVKAIVPDSDNAINSGQIDVIEQFANKSLFNKIKPFLIEFPVLTTLMKQGKQAYQRNNKDGFKALPSVNDLNVYQDANDAILQLFNRTREFRQQLNTELIHSNEKYTSDTLIFTSIMKKLYGEVSEV